MHLRKKFVILLTLTFVLNRYSVATATELISSAAFGNVIKVQSTLMNVSFGIYLPLKLIGTVLTEEHAAPLDTSSSEEQGKKDSKGNAAAASVVILPAKEEIKDLRNFTGNCTDLLCAACAIFLAAPVFVAPLQDTGQGTAVFLMLLLYMICLSLSNLPLPVFTRVYICIRSRLRHILQTGFYFAPCDHDRELFEYDFGGNHVF